MTISRATAREIEASEGSPAGFKSLSPLAQADLVGCLAEWAVSNASDPIVRSMIAKRLVRVARQIDPASYWSPDLDEL